MDSTKNLFSKQNYILFFLLIVLVVALLTWAVWYISVNNGQLSNNPIIAESKILINEKGIRWGPLPTGKYNFQVTSADTAEGPVFLEGEINPPDVHVGDTQHLRVVVQSPAGIKSVTAYIETDNGEEVLPLSKTGVVTYKDMQPEKYVVNTDGNLEILPTLELYARHLKKIVAERGGLINQAQAQQGEKESWENSWLVRDTHNTTYHTTFVAEDNAGLTKSLTIAWSDVCGIPMDGDWNLRNDFGIDCIINSVDGVDNGNVEIELFSLTVNDTFAFNDGKIIDMNRPFPGQLIMGSDGKIKKTNLWVCDPDGDRYIRAGVLGNQFAQDNNPGSFNCSFGGAYNPFFDRVLAFFSPEKAQADTQCGDTATDKGGIRRYLINGQEGDDCWDGSLHAHKNATEFCFTPHTNGFDYNCDGDITEGSTDIAIKDCSPTVNDCLQTGCSGRAGANGQAGWAGPVPNCGEEALWWDVSCSFEPEPGVCIIDVPPYSDCSLSTPGLDFLKRQACR